MNLPRISAAAALLIGLGSLHATGPAADTPIPARWQLIAGSYTIESPGQPERICPTVWKFDPHTGRAWYFVYRFTEDSMITGWMEAGPLTEIKADKPPQKPPRTTKP